MNDVAGIRLALVALNETLQKQNELQLITISALESLTKMLLHTASSVNVLNAELKHDAEAEPVPAPLQGSGAAN